MSIEFMSDSFLLSNAPAEALYNNFAKRMPIIDYHCHIPIEDIYFDRKYNNIGELWLGADHYKWRAMRAAGIEEKYITGDATYKEKLDAYLSVLPKLVGNPLYHWSCLELKRYFGIRSVPKASASDELWDFTSKMLQSDSMSAKSIILSSNVEALCTTDDPAATLEYHRALANSDYPVKVYPAFRPDKGMNPDRAGYAEYISSLSKASGVMIDSLASLKEAYKVRLDEFLSLGMRTADHGFDDYVRFTLTSDEEADLIFRRALSGDSISGEDASRFRSNMILYFASEYKKSNTVMQIHFGVLRNPNSKMYRLLGPDSGYDTIYGQSCIYDIAKMLDAMNERDILPRTVLYSVDPGDNAALDSLACAFNGEGQTLIQHGSAWWFNDSLKGMREQLSSLASLSCLGSFIGMTTDSRSLVSYTRHEYFRRILCDMLGRMVVNGEYPPDYEALAQIVCDVSYNNVKKFFNM